MAKVRVYDRATGGRYAEIDCPGCGYGHAFSVDVADVNGNKWEWNNDIENPTFSPSMLVFGGNPECRCHSFVRDGKIEFLGDCFHNLKGQTIELPEIE